MSNPISSLHNPQGIHRRQHSTPILAFEAMKMERPTTQRYNSQHRRGQSQDSRSPIRRQLHQRTGSAVSITNQGTTTQGQQILREAQQQRIARPGQQSQIELPVSPQCGIYQTMSNSMSMSPYDNMSMNAIMQQPQAMTTHSQFIQQDFKMPMTAGLSMNFELDENNHYFQNSHMMNQYMGGVPLHDRRMSQPELRIHTGMRPLTPAEEIQSGMWLLRTSPTLLISAANFPLTPATTPFRIQQAQYSRSLQTSPVHQFQDENIQSPYPVSLQKSRSLQGIVEQDEGAFQQQEYEVADMPVPSMRSTQEPIKQAPLPAKQSTSWEGAEEQSLPYFDETGGEPPKIEGQQVPVLASSDVADGSLSPKRPALSPRRMSISDLNLEPGISASIEETNVSLDDIAQFIEGPDPKDNKWICKYEECNKRFGRKENIKSHIQTHLGDRQFRCDHCKKCFVRGHDLKRHAKIHTGTKPYPCLCGNAFARHDALTRHRQRGMCVGAFEGIVKKAIKRGRPRKHRPDMEDRMTKASRSRNNQASSELGHDQEFSSGSSCSMSSWGSPPTESMDHLSIRGQSPYEDFDLFAMQHQANQNMVNSMVMPPDVFTFTPPASPGYSTGNKPSPSYRELTPVEMSNVSIQVSQPNNVSSEQGLPIVSGLPTMNPTSSMLSANQFGMQFSEQSLPSLSHSSSSPAPDVVAFDFGPEDPTMSSMQSMGMSMNMGYKNEDRNDFDSFLDYNSMEIGLDHNGPESFFNM